MEPQSLNKDFQDVLSHIKRDLNLVSSFTSEEMDIFKRIHSRTYAILLTQKKLKENRHGCIFIDEILSDAIQILPLLLRGYNKVATYLLRDILENCLKYVYYYDHKIELSWLESGEKYIFTIDEFIQYLERHPMTSNHVIRLKLKDKIKTLYSNLSKVIHSSSSKHMQLVKYLEAVKYDHACCQEYFSIFEKVTDIVVTIIILFNCERFNRLPVDERRLVLNAIGKEYKKYIQALS